ncbi:MAG: TIGR00341 family protein [Candidatus Ranarchaeia archaeon]
MRQIQAVVPSAFKLTPIIEKIYDKVQVKPTILRAEANILVTVNVEDQDSGDIMNIFQREGVGSKFGSLSIMPVLASYPKQPKPASRLSRVSIDELETTVVEAGELSKRFILFAILASVVASLGLIANLPVIVLASMILGPHMGPIISTSLAMVLGKTEIVRRGILTEIIGILLAIGVGWGLGLVIPETSLTSEILIRTSPTIYDFGLAVVSGIAISYSYTYGLSTALIGVAVSSALVPPASTIGLTLAMNDIPSAIGSSTLLLMNILTINIIVALTFWFQKVRPLLDFKKAQARRYLGGRMIIVIVLLAALMVPIVQSYGNIQLENQINGLVRQDLEDLNPYQGIIDIGGITTVIYPAGKIILEVEVTSMFDLNATVAQNIQSHLETSIPGYNFTVYLRTIHVTQVVYPNG